MGHPRYTIREFYIDLFIVLAALVLGWCGGNIVGDQVRKNEIGFDVGTRIGYWVKGLSVGGVIGFFLVITRNLFRKKQSKN